MQQPGTANSQLAVFAAGEGVGGCHALGGDVAGSSNGAAAGKHGDGREGRIVEHKLREQLHTQQMILTQLQLQVLTLLALLVQKYNY